MGRKSRFTEPERTHRLSLAELASHDDACSDAMIDNVCCFHSSWSSHTNIDRHTTSLRYGRTATSTLHYEASNKTRSPRFYFTKSLSARIQSRVKKRC